MFDGKSGRKPSAEARRYIYAVLATAIVHDLLDLEGWIFGGMDEEPDRRRARKAALAIKRELEKKAAG